MKHFLLEPKLKKSVSEYQRFVKQIDDKNSYTATMETGWRWGSWVINCPETEEEVVEWGNNRVGDPSYYKNAMEVVEDYGYDTLEEFVEHATKPEETANFHELDDYDHELIETWDGCWEYWEVQAWGDHREDVTDEEIEELQEHVEEIWYEDYNEAMYEDGWEEQAYWTDINCEVKLTPCDQNGKVFEGEEVHLEFLAVK